MENEKLTKWLIDYMESEKEHRQQAIKIFEKWYEQATKN